VKQDLHRHKHKDGLKNKMLYIFQLLLTFWRDINRV